MTIESASYAHRPKDGVFESICRMCYRTVAVEMYEEYLAEDENHHICHENHTFSVRRLLPSLSAKPN